MSSPDWLIEEKWGIHEVPPVQEEVLKEEREEIPQERVFEQLVVGFLRRMRRANPQDSNLLKIITWVEGRYSRRKEFLSAIRVDRQNQIMELAYNPSNQDLGVYTIKLDNRFLGEYEDLLKANEEGETEESYVNTELAGVLRSLVSKYGNNPARIADIFVTDMMNSLIVTDRAEENIFSSAGQSVNFLTRLRARLERLGTPGGRDWW